MLNDFAICSTASCVRGRVILIFIFVTNNSYNSYDNLDLV